MEACSIYLRTYSAFFSRKCLFQVYKCFEFVKRSIIASLLLDTTHYGPVASPPYGYVPPTSYTTEANRTTELHKIHDALQPQVSFYMQSHLIHHPWWPGWRIIGRCSSCLPWLWWWFRYFKWLVVQVLFRYTAGGVLGAEAATIGSCSKSLTASIQEIVPINFIPVTEVTLFAVRFLPLLALRSFLLLPTDSLALSESIRILSLLRCSDCRLSFK